MAKKRARSTDTRQGSLAKRRRGQSSTPPEASQPPTPLPHERLKIGVYKEAEYALPMDPHVVGKSKLEETVAECIVVHDPDVKYGNPEGISMLKKLHSMEENLDSLLNDRVTQKALNESQKALNESLKVQARRKTVEIESLKAQVRRQGDEIDAHETCIQIFSDDRRNITLPIRVRFFRVYQRDFMDMNVDVKAGNDAAHGGALKMDVRVFMELEMGEQDYAAFERLYGMSVGTALRFTDFVLIRDVLSKLAGHAAAGDDRPFVTALRTDFIETILRSSNEEIARAIADEDSIIQDLSRAISNIRIRRG